MTLRFPALTILAALGALCAPVYAAAPNASDLGLVLAHEEACGLHFDQGAITAYIEANVPADDLAFPGKLQNAILFQKNAAGASMTESQRTALCAQVGRLAKTLGFVTG